MGDSKDPVRLRKRVLANGNTSLYLDIYLNGRRSYEFLKMYLVPESNRKDKEKNRDTLRLAEAVRAKRIVEIRNGEYGFQNRSGMSVLFFDYFESYIAKRSKSESKGNWATLKCSIKHLRQYDPREKITFADITPEWIEGYRKYLEEKASAFGICSRALSQNTRRLYFNHLRACLSQAVRDDILQKNPMNQVESIKSKESTRMYLTIDEIKKAVATPCDNDVVKRAFLFSCLTGLRRSDIKKLSWSEISRQNGFTRIIFRQKKTQGQEYLDITEQAAQLLNECNKTTDRPFGELPCTDNTNIKIKTWLKRAGINKHITFHCARHTFAVMMLDLGTDIYTVSKLLGHRELGTTQIYAKVLDKNKQAAVAAIPSILKPENDSKDDDS